MPKIVDRDKKRSEIARKAIEVLARRGFQATTIQDIADASGLGKGTVYHYFKTKEEILLAVSGELLNDMERSLGAALLRKELPADKLSVLIRESLRLTEEMEHLFIVYLELLLMDLRGSRHGDCMAMIKNLLHNMRGMVAGFIEEGKKRGDWPKDADSSALAVYLIASFDGVLAHYLMDRASFDIEHVGDAFARFFLREREPDK
ncbi:MAG: Fatty acid metabolism regulator protein [Syntrophaceae bacterium PtaU1.Bin231]|nr:MAG: Fatty acid metabolism regulator protein [Syntrophaceae bacterium PtaU1.Bin231]